MVVVKPTGLPPSFGPSMPLQYRHADPAQQSHQVMSTVNQQLQPSTQARQPRNSQMAQQFPRPGSPLQGSPSSKGIRTSYVQSNMITDSGSVQLQQNVQLVSGYSSESCEIRMPLFPSHATAKMQQNPSQQSYDWLEHTSPDGKRYYYNKRTGHSSWEKPFEITEPTELYDASTAWTEFTTPDGQIYFYNMATKQSKWTIPDELKLAHAQAGKPAVQPGETVPVSVMCTAAAPSGPSVLSVPATASLCSCSDGMQILNSPEHLGSCASASRSTSPVEKYTTTIYTESNHDKNNPVDFAWSPPSASEQDLEESQMEIPVPRTKNTPSKVKIVDDVRQIACPDLTAAPQESPPPNGPCLPLSTGDIQASLQQLFHQVHNVTEAVRAIQEDQQLILSNQWKILQREDDILASIRRLSGSG